MLEAGGLALVLISASQEARLERHLTVWHLSVADTSPAQPPGPQSLAAALQSRGSGLQSSQPPEIPLEGIAARPAGPAPGPGFDLYGLVGFQLP